MTDAAGPTGPTLLDLDLAQLTALMAELGQPVWRARQVWRQIWQRGVVDPLEMSDLPRSLREQLAERRADAPTPRCQICRQTCRARQAGWPSSAISAVNCASSRSSSAGPAGPVASVIARPESFAEQIARAPRELGRRQLALPRAL